MKLDITVTFFSEALLVPDPSIFLGQCAVRTVPLLTSPKPVMRRRFQNFSFSICNFYIMYGIYDWNVELKIILRSWLS